MTLTYDDCRFGDRYEITLNPDGTFGHAVRFVDDTFRDPLHYDKLTNIPSPHREAIDHLIWQRTHKQ